MADAETLADLQRAFESKDYQALALSLASGVGSISISRDANDASLTTNVHIGDRRLELTREAVEALREACRLVLPPPLHNLPPETAHFMGRSEEEEQLFDALAQGQGSRAISALRGLGGIGKTELAVRVAHKLSLHYPAAQLIIDLRGTEDQPTSVRDAMENLILRFEPEAKLPDDDQAIGEIYRDLLSHRKALLILDNAGDAAQVMPLLPPAPSAALVTSRPLLDLPDVQTYRLDSLKRPQSCALLMALLGEPPISEADLDVLAEACADHPLSLQVAGNFLAKRRDRLSPERYTKRITENRDALRMEGLDDYDVMAALDASLKLLLEENPDLAERWRDLAVFPEDFDAAAAAAVWNLPEDEEPVEAAFDLLSRLEDMAFAEPGGGKERFRLHDLMRDLAERGQPRERFREPAIRHAVHYCIALGRADEIYLQGGAKAIMAALRLYDLERSNIEAGHAFAATNLSDNKTMAALANIYASSGVHVLSLRLLPHEQIRWWTVAMAGARETGDRHVEGNALGNLGIAYDALGEIRKAIEFHDQALIISREIGDRRAEGNSLGNLGIAYAALGETRKAIEFHEQALVVSREIGDRRVEGNSLGNLGIAYDALGETRKAIEFHDQALIISREIGDRRAEGNSLGNLGTIYAALGEAGKAIEFYELSLAIFTEIEDPDAQKVREQLAAVRAN